MKKTLITLVILQCMSISLTAQTTGALGNSDNIGLLDGETQSSDSLSLNKESNKHTTTCHFKEEIKEDEFSETRSGNKTVVEELFISYTPKNSKKRFTFINQAVNCTLSCALLADSARVVYFDWELYTAKNQKSLGSLNIGTKCEFILKNGQTFVLSFAQYDAGTINVKQKCTRYSSYIRLNDEALALLESNEVEMIRVHWSNSTQDYPIYDSQVFMKQIPCIK